MRRPPGKRPAYGADTWWYDALNDPGAGQMIHLKNLVLSKPYFERIPDQSLVAVNGRKYNHLVATRGEEYAFVYTYSGKPMQVNLGKTKGKNVKAIWYSPLDGTQRVLGVFPNSGIRTFDPPEEGTDWVLILEKS